MDGRDDPQPQTDSLDLDRVTLPPGPPNRCQPSSGNEVGQQPRSRVGSSVSHTFATCITIDVAMAACR